MIKNIITLIDGEEQNDFYDYRKSCNGGGYHQPLYKYEFEYNNKKYTLVHSNTSCGDFGIRYYTTITNSENKKVYDFTVDRVGNSEEELYFSEEFDVAFFFNLRDSELKEFIDFDTYDEVLDFHIVEVNDYFDDDED